MSVVNQGTIDPTGPARSIWPRPWTNSGTLQATGGGTLNVQATAWSNTGLITETNSTLILGGTFTTSDLGNYSRTGGNINLAGTLNNTGSTLGLTAVTGSWNLLGGTIQGGTVTVSGGAKLVPTTSGGTLSGVTLKGDAAQTQPVMLDVNGYTVYVSVAGDLTLDNATLNVQNYGRIDFTSSVATLAGSGTVLFADDNRYNSLRAVANAGQLTIGAGITVKGAGGTIGYNNQWGGPANVTVVNQGNVGPDRPGTFYLAGASWTNNATVQATAGGSLNILQPTSWTNATGKQISITGGGTLSLGGTYSNLGDISATNSTVNLGSTFTLALGMFNRRRHGSLTGTRIIWHDLTRNRSELWAARFRAARSPARAVRSWCRQRPVARSTV
jgi:hypothetical protein